MSIKSKILRIMRPNNKSSGVFQLHPQHQLLKNKLSESKNIIDLGCGNNPIPEAKVAVDCFIDPVQRAIGAGDKINDEKFQKLGIRFVNAKIDERLPFKDNEFDFSYSAHAFEHLNNPEIACKEVMRISKSGVIITPTYFSDIIFGREYHKWLIIYREKSLYFFQKQQHEDRPFGDHPKWSKEKHKWVVDKSTNPFDILLNDGNWYNGNENLERLSSKLRKEWYSHSPLIENYFFWDGDFEYHVVR